MSGSAAGWAGTPLIDQMTTEQNTKKVFATYRTTTCFEIPAEVKEWDIHWDTLVYVDKDGNEVEVESDMAGNPDSEMYHRPSDCYEEFEEPDEVPEAFFTYFEDSTTKDLLEMLWNRMKSSEKKEILEEAWLGAQASADSSETSSEAPVEKESDDE